MILSQQSRKQVNTLVPYLKDHAMKPEEMLEKLHLPKEKESYSRLTIIINTLSKEYPLFEPCPHQYKILTVKDEEEYQEELRRCHPQVKEYAEW